MFVTANESLINLQPHLSQMVTSHKLNSIIGLNCLNLTSEFRKRRGKLKPDMHSSVSRIQNRSLTSGMPAFRSCFAIL